MLDENYLEYEENQDHVTNNSWISSSLNDLELSPFNFSLNQNLHDNAPFIPLDIVSLEIEENIFEEMEAFHYIASESHLSLYPYMFSHHVSENVIQNSFVKDSYMWCFDSVQSNWDIYETPYHSLQYFDQEDNPFEKAMRDSHLCN